jgi:hypothetical protein
MAEAAPAIGTLADSVKKWADVTVPAGLNETLSGLSAGVQSFSWAFMGGWSIGAISGPLGALADDVKKWSDVKVPTGMKDGLTDLSDGVKSFTWAFMGGWSLSSINGPLAELADSVKKWNGVKIPKGLKDSLTGLADGVISFSWAFVGGWSLSSITGPLGDLADSVKKWKGVSVPKGLPTSLGTLATAIKKLSGISYTTIASGLSKVSDGFKDFGSNAVGAIAKGANNAQKSLITAATGISNTMLNTLKTKYSSFTEIGEKTIGKYISGMKNKKKSATEAASSLASGSANGTREAYESFYNAAAYLVAGFASGINANKYIAAARARAMARAAADAAEDELDIQSPSRVGYGIGDFFGIGFVNAIVDNIRGAYKASANMAESARNGLNTAIKKINGTIDTGIDTQPTIRPVLDLSDVKSGAGVIGGLLNANSVGVSANIGAISTMMNRRNQNGANGDVIAALKDLKKTIGSSVGNSYNINGISYSEGDDVSEALKTIVRAVKIDGRA